MHRVVQIFILVTLLSGWSLPAHTVSHLNFETKNFQHELETRALNYFLENTHPDTGLVLDRSHNWNGRTSQNRVASIAATGFGMAVVAQAYLKGMVTKEFAKDYVSKTLKFSLTKMFRYRGWFFHFIDWQTGQRVWKSEISNIDTALFLAGAISAAQILNDSNLHQLVMKIYSDLDFHAFLTDEGKKPNKKTLSLSYSPEEGYSKWQWNIYAEQRILLILGLGHPTRPLPKVVWNSWMRGLNQGKTMPLFIHQYSEMFLNFEKIKDGKMNHHQASIQATRFQRSFAFKGDSQSFRSGFWGVSAGDGPFGYKAFEPRVNSTTLCIGCALGSLHFDPKNILSDAQQWSKGEFSNKIWGRYGFIDSLNIDQKWFGQEVIGITVGPIFISSSNIHPETDLRLFFHRHPSIQKALQTIQK